VVQRS